MASKSKILTYKQLMQIVAQDELVAANLRAREAEILARFPIRRGYEVKPK